MKQCIIFRINDQQFALPIEVVHRVVRAVAIQPLAQASNHVQGVVDYHGSIVPVVGVRSVFGIGNKDLDLTDVMVICEHKEKLVALLVDGITPTAHCELIEEMPKEVVPMPDAIDHFVRNGDSIVPMYALERMVASVNAS